METFEEMCKRLGITTAEQQEGARKIYDQLVIVDAEDTRVRIGAGEIIHEQSQRIQNLEKDLELIKIAIKEVAPQKEREILMASNRLRSGSKD